jgi:20S proteasome alpha/beta subunit
MTFVVGIRCQNGIVLCSDSLEGDGITKRSRHKLIGYSVGEEWGAAWGLAGEGDVIDKFTDRLKIALGNGHYDKYTLEEKVETVLRYVKTDYPTSNLQIVAASFGPPFDKNLYRGTSEVGCLSPEDEYACAGTDVTLAQFALRSIYNPLITVGEGINLGIFVTSLMKEYAEGVGLDIQVLTYTYGLPQFRKLHKAEITAIEEQFPIEDASAAISGYWASKNPQSPAVLFKNMRAKLGMGGFE